MRQRRKPQSVSNRYLVCNLCLICCLCLSGCHKKTQNTAVQDTVLSIAIQEEPVMAAGSASVNDEPENAGPGTDETAKIRKKSPDKAIADEAEKDKSGIDNEKASGGTGEAGGEDKDEEGQPGTERPETERPETERPETERPEAGQSETEPSADGQSDAGTALTQQPQTGQNNLEQPPAEQHTHSWSVVEVTKQPGCLEQGSRTEICTICETVRETVTEATGHDMITQWYGEEPDCTHGGYRAVLCARCGWVDEASCGNAEALGHTPQAVEIQHGNCREDTIIIYTCSRCKEQTGYDRHTEPDEHKWVWKDTQIWDEEALEFVTIQIECCERCNARP